jgi:uncharacterized membrane protein YqjE
VISATATPEPRAEDRRAAANAGFIGRISGFLAALASYLSARFQLAGLEAKEAMLHYAIVAGLLAGGLVVVVFGYFFLVLFAVFGIAWAIGGPHTWIWVSLGAAVVHFAGAVALVFIARAKLSTPMFTATLEEFKKDNQWLTTSARPS